MSKSTAKWQALFYTLIILLSVLLLLAVAYRLGATTGATAGNSVTAGASGTEGAVPEESASATEVTGEIATEITADSAQTEAAPDQSFDRASTVIFDIDGGRVTDPGLWNPFVPGSRLDHGYQQAILEPLFILNYQTGELLPWLGERFNANQTLDVWTLTLRDGVTWQDGEAFNAEDVVYTANMLLEYAPDLANSGYLAQWVESVEQIDELTVQFNLTEPNPRFQLDIFSVKIFGSFNVMPEHIWAGQDPLTFTYYFPEQGWPLGTGPYTLESVNPTEFTYVRDDDWWGAKSGFMDLPAPEQLVWTAVGPEETRAALMADDALDVLGDITLGTLQVIQERNPNVQTWFDGAPYAWVPDPCSRTLEFNNAVEPWNDPEMRWAINYAIDRDQIVNIAYEGTTLKSRHFFPMYPPLEVLVKAAESAGAWDTEQLWTVDPERTREILEAKGYTLDNDGYYALDGEVLSLEITTHEAFIEKQRIASVLVEQLQAAGINATTRNEASGTWLENFNLGTFEARMAWHTCGSVNEPWSSLNTFNSRWLLPVGERSNNNENSWRWSGDAAEEYSAVVDEMGSLPLGAPQVQTLFVEAMDIWFDELPVIPITQAKKIIPVNTTYWTGWPTFENDYVHPPMWWQSAHVVIHQLEPTGAQ